MKIVFVALSLLAFAGTSRAACPNACSGHGTCGVDDQCICHTNFEGGDCSQRVCPYGTAWVTTSNGDLNFDGDRFDGTQYNKDYSFDKNTANSKLATQRSPGGDWESWPYYAKPGEGHFPMECSNRGLCLQDTGECQCFEGYTGSACQRSVCPSGCSGHGTCESIEEMRAIHNSRHSAKLYTLWDKDMQRTCLCDAGYTGIACNQRNCPVGDDPLTTYELALDHEVQFITVKADTEFGGKIKLTYTAPNGQEYTTDGFEAGGIQTSEGKTALGNEAQAALRALPNNVLNEVLVKADYCDTIIAGKFDVTVAGGGTKDELITIAVAANGGYQEMYPPQDVAAPVVPTSGLIRFNNNVYDLDNSGKIVLGYFPYQSDGAVADQTLTRAEYRHCIRYEVTFMGRSGDVAPLRIDTSDVNVPMPGAMIVGDAASEVVYVKATTTVELALGGDLLNSVSPASFGIGNVGYTESKDNWVVYQAGISYGHGTVTDSSATSLDISASLSNGLVPRNDIAAITGIVHVHHMVRHGTTGDTSSVQATNSNTKALADSGTKFSVMVKDGNDEVYCDPSDAALLSSVNCASWIIRCKFTSVSEGTDDEADGGAIRTTAGVSVLTCAGAATAIYGPDGVVETDMSQHINYGSRVNVYCNGESHGMYTVKTSDATSLTFNEVVHDCNGDYVNDADGVTTAPRNTNMIVTLTDQVVVMNVDFEPYSGNLDGETIEIKGPNAFSEKCKVQSSLGYSAASLTHFNRIVCANTFTEQLLYSIQTATSISSDGATESEASTCSDRGLCNFETGMCDCFGGYTGVACESQNALHI